jgi:universal stress protein A
MKTNNRSTKSHIRKAAPRVRTSPSSAEHRRALNNSPLAIQSILVPLDFSVSSEKALAYAVALASQFGARLTLLHVVEPAATPDFAKSFPLVMENDRVTAECKARLDRLAEDQTIRPQLIEKRLVRHGRSFREIADAARTLKVDLIVISTHGYTGLKHAFLGSTTERVVRLAPCPVLVVRQKEHDFVAN